MAATEVDQVEGAASIYTFGGAGLDGLSDRLMLFEDRQWTVVKPMSSQNPSPRRAAGLVAIGIKLYLLGGTQRYQSNFGRDDGGLADFWEFNTWTRTWTLLVEDITKESSEYMPTLPVQIPQACSSDGCAAN